MRRIRFLVVALLTAGALGAAAPAIAEPVCVETWTSSSGRPGVGPDVCQQTPFAPLASAGKDVQIPVNQMHVGFNVTVVAP